jgi:hypothetical protein
VTVAGITGSGATLNFTSPVTAVAGSSGAWTFTLGGVTTAALGTPTYTSGTVAGSSSQYIVGTALSPATGAGDIISAAIACHNAARAA